MNEYIIKVLRIIFLGLTVGLCIATRWLSIIHGPLNIITMYILGGFVILSFICALLLYYKRMPDHILYTRFIVSIAISIILAFLISHLIGDNIDSLILGDYLAISAKQYNMLPIDSILHTFIILVVGIYSASICYTYISFNLSCRKSLFLLFRSILASITILFAYSLSFYTVMLSGLLSLVIIATIIISSILVALSIAFITGSIQVNNVVARYSYPLLLLVVFTIICVVLGSGGHYYYRIKGFYPDVSYVYIHIQSDGSHRRTIDQEGQDVKLRKLTQFVASYPFSAYRPAAILSIAECQFSLWRYHDSKATLSEIISLYPSMGNYPRVLRVLSSLGTNDSESIHNIIENEDLSGLFNGQGSLIAASVYERANQPYRSLGYYSAYIDYSLRQPSSPNIQESISFAKFKIDTIHNELLKSGSEILTGNLKVHVLTGNKPLALCRIALVQPHYNTALPSDSRHFTGSWSIPAWNSYWGVTDKNGKAIIRNIPFGSYDLVLGLNAKTTQKNMVAGYQKSPIVISSSKLHVLNISLKARVEVICPQQLSLFKPSEKLVWHPYSGVDHYSVTILKFGAIPNIERGGSFSNAATFWSRGNIRGNSTLVDPRFFVGSIKCFDADSVYMWIVFAYDSKGRLISSSEHYFDFFEPTFTTSRQASAMTPSKGGYQK